MKHQIIEQNRRGRDFFIGDIHGHKAKFARALASVEFNPEQGDRLFYVGDLIDRGNDNLQILGKQLHWDYFYSTIGNHELMLMDAFEKSPISTPYTFDGFTHSNLHIKNNGRWFARLRQSTRDHVYQQVSGLPVTMEVKTAWGDIGLVHAEVPLGFTSWPSFVEAVQTSPRVFEQALWGRDIMRIAHEYDARALDYPDTINLPINGVDVVVHGHTLVKKPKLIGNRLYIDTGLETGELTILSAEQIFQNVVTET